MFLSSAYVVSSGPTCRNSLYLCIYSFIFLSFCHSVSNFLVIQLANALVSGSGSDILLSQDIEPSNSRDRLSHAPLRFWSLAEQCQTQIFYLRCFNSDFDAVNSKFGLLIDIEDDLKKEDCTKNWHEHRHCTSKYDLFGMIVNIAVGASQNKTSTLG